eukprot:7985339-Lingulodinium_polyedra.AAC.1
MGPQTLSPLQGFSPNTVPERTHAQTREQNGGPAGERMDAPRVLHTRPPSRRQPGNLGSAAVVVAVPMANAAPVAAVAAVAATPAPARILHTHKHV